MEITNYQLAGAPHAMSVAVIADFHNGDPEPILAALRERRPDAILVAGDTVHDGKRFAEGLALLRRLITVAPVFCALGNHEYRCEDIEARIRRTGARLLDNSYTTLGGFVIGDKRYRSRRRRYLYFFYFCFNLFKLFYNVFIRF